MATAWREPARISRNGCSSAGRGGQTAGPTPPIRMPMTHERFPSMSRKPTARTSAARSPQNERTAPRLSAPGFTVTTRKIAARVSGVATGCGTAAGAPAISGVVIGSDPIGSLACLCLSLRVHTGGPADPPWTKCISRGALRQQTLPPFLLGAQRPQGRARGHACNLHRSA